MEIKKNVAVAITTAVYLYMEAEQHLTAPAVVERKVAEAPRPAFSPWALSGRSAAMEMRRYWQMRLMR